jgi:hypothetical protein
MNSPETLRFVVLHHTGIAEAHFDLMFETAAGSKLATWRLKNWPPKPEDIATPLGDHRREYLEYEGPISGNRGQVHRLATGRLKKLEQEGADILVTLEDGQRLKLPRRG